MRITLLMPQYVATGIAASDFCALGLGFTPGAIGSFAIQTVEVVDISGTNPVPIPFLFVEDAIVQALFANNEVPIPPFPPPPSDWRGLILFPDGFNNVPAGTRVRIEVTLQRSSGVIACSEISGFQFLQRIGVGRLDPSNTQFLEFSINAPKVACSVPVLSIPVLSSRALVFLCALLAVLGALLIYRNRFRSP